MAGDAVTVVLPCLNEEESLPAVLAAIPAGYRALVVDNNSTDDTATVAARHGAQVLSSRGPDTARRCMPVCSPRPPPS
ncbi:glycosyl transferase family protein [Mycobacterium tuberculosis]|nr:glycosyl transferase family protein [Mycobacterium tuberculosis]